jgi:acyl carrier protein
VTRRRPPALCLAVNDAALIVSSRATNDHYCPSRPIPGDRGRPPRSADLAARPLRARLSSRAPAVTDSDTLGILKELLGRPQKGVSPKVDVDAITGDTRIDEIGLDSLATLDFLYDVETRLQIQIEIADLVALDRVSDLVAYLEAKRTG